MERQNKKAGAPRMTMNNRTACGFALLLLVQAMSAALYVVPMDTKQEEWQGPVLESGARSNNSSSGCGYDVNYTSMNTYAPTYVLSTGTINVYINTYCDLLNTSMYLTASLTNQNNGSTYTVANATYNGSNVSFSGNWSIPASSLGVGNYTLTSTLRYYDGSTWPTIETDTNNFSITAPVTNPCGVDPNSASVYAYSHYGSYEIGHNFTGTISTYCSITNSTMVLDWTIRSWTTNASVDSGSFNWTATNTYESHNVTSTALASMGIGNYSFEATLSWYNNSSMSLEVLDLDSDSFFIYNNTNSGPGSLGCGYDLNYTDVFAYAPYYGIANQSIDTMMYVQCPMYNSSMLLNYWIYDGSNVTLDSGNYSWTASSNGTTHYWNATSLPVGNYTFHVELYSNGSYVASNSDGFTVISNNSGGGGNNGGNQTSPCGNNVSYTSVYAYAPFTVMENQSFTTSMYVNCEITSANMLLDYYIFNTNYYTVYSGNQSWYGTANHSNFTGSVFGLAAGNYTFHADLYVNGTLVDSDSDSFVVYANNSGGNNTGGNGTGNNSMYDVAHCLHLRNISVDSSYYVSVDLENSCSIDIHYPGINATTNDAGVSGLSDTWWYLLWANGTYNSGWQLSFSSAVQNNTLITLNFNASILNCGPNGYHACPNSMNSSSSFQFTYLIASGNNTGGNNTGGNNTGGNNTGNNTGGNSTGNSTGNNTGGNSTGNSTGNNTGGNSTGNNTGGNNTVLDADGDGVLDADDLCPNSTPGASVDATGCEATVQPVNNPPEVTSVTITPLIATVDDTLNCSYSTTDSDGDAVTTIVTWAVNGTIISTGSDTLTGGFGVGQTVACSVVASDGAASSSPFISTTVILPSGSDELVEDAGGLLPSLSMMGTLVAIAFGVGLSRRQDD